MDFWTDIAFAVVLRILKDRKQSAQFKSALFKLHAKIEEMFPELQPDSEDSKEQGGTR